MPRMRIWNLPCRDLSSMHLLGEHAELHGIWTIITQDRHGYANHPETRRWRGRLGALYSRHEEQVRDMERRGYQGHRSPLDQALIPAEDSWDWPAASDEQVARDRVDIGSRYPGWRKDNQLARRAPPLAGDGTP